MPMNKTRIAFIASLIFIAVFFCVYYCFCLRCSNVQESGNLRNKTKIETEKRKSDIFKVCFNEKARDSLQSSAERLQRGENEEVSKKCFNVEIADTPEARAIGLMNREYLNPDSGMLFIFDTEEKYCFWMKNTLVPLDIVWLGKNKDVVFIKHNAEPCKADPCETFRPDKKAKYVLEINSGLAKEIGLKKGDGAEFQ